MAYKVDPKHKALPQLRGVAFDGHRQERNRRHGLLYRAATRLLAYAY